MRRNVSAGKFVQKPKDFVDWANAVIAVAKHELAPYENGDRIGLEARSRSEAGQLCLAN